VPPCAPIATARYLCAILTKFSPGLLTESAYSTAKMEFYYVSMTGTDFRATDE